MDTNQMKNIIVLKDLPSNIVDEAIVILKNNSNVKKKETIENKNANKFEEQSNGSYELAVREAEYIIHDYINNIEKPKENKVSLAKMKVKYKKLQVSSILLGITTIIGIIMCVVN